ncbi:hypothetical protein K456DRAFT_28535 [Colletotrichum gloeosporioides 23]|nr:hypothetical protein K456DRAFT_28535 [Colletotrichum gloeosporioides 23]
MVQLAVLRVVPRAAFWCRVGPHEGPVYGQGVIAFSDHVLQHIRTLFAPLKGACIPGIRLFQASALFSEGGPSKAASRANVVAIRGPIVTDGLTACIKFVVRLLLLLRQGAVGNWSLGAVTQEYEFRRKCVVGGVGGFGGDNQEDAAWTKAEDVHTRLRFLKLTDLGNSIASARNMKADEAFRTAVRVDTCPGFTGHSGLLLLTGNIRKRTGNGCIREIWRDGLAVPALLMLYMVRRKLHLRS